jgi:hypothetical protein
LRHFATGRKVAVSISDDVNECFKFTYSFQLPVPGVYSTPNRNYGNLVAICEPDPTIASQKLQTCLLAIKHWLTKWRLKANTSKSTRLKANTSKSTHVTFTTRTATCPGVLIYNEQLPQAEEVKYLGLHLDRRLTWHKHIFAKRKYLGITLSKNNTGCWAVSPNFL